MDLFNGDVIKYILIYLLCINLFGFFIMWLDKRKAKLGEWRIPEKTLFMVTILGGGFGTILGMYKFRHKTQKYKFTVGLPVILLTEIFLVIYLIINIKLGKLDNILSIS